MISKVSGKLTHRELDRVEIMTGGGVAFECLVPLSVLESLPSEGSSVVLHTHLVVREDGWQLYGFSHAHERSVFQKLLGAKGVGPALALGILSALTAERVVRALRDRDVSTLTRVPRVGRKKAEQIILDLADKMETLDIAGSVEARMEGDDAAVGALMTLGFNQAEASRAVRAVAETGMRGDISTLVRAALARLTSS